jgi:hypothetical protein
MIRRDVRHSPPKLSLKVATSELIDAVGGTAKGESYCRADQRRLSDYQNPNTDAFMPSDVIVDLERRAVGSAGWPQVTREQARQHGFVLVKVPDVAPAREDLIGSVGRLAKENGELSSSICDALSDGVVTPDEAATALALAYRQQETLASLVSQLKAFSGDE